MSACGVRWRLAAWRWRVAVWLGQHPQALAELDRWLAVAPPSDIQGRRQAIWHAWATRAHVLAAMHRWPEAVDQLQALTHAQPLHAAHHFNLGFAMQRTGQWAQAEQAFRQALELSPRLDVAWFGLGDVLQRQGQHAEAEQAWARQTELQPFCSDGLERLVQMHVALGQWHQATQRLDQIKAFAPRTAMALEPLMSGAPLQERARA